MKCPACNLTSDFVLIEKIGKFSLYKCRVCDLVFSNPMEIDSYYYERHPDYERLEKIADTPLAWYHRLFLKTLPQKGGALLDVGCATGNFLNACKASYKVWGIDFNKKLVSSGKSFYKLDKLYAVSPEGFRRRFRERFDVITCFETLEHQSNPGRFVHDLKALLKPGGLLMLSVPNRPVSSLLLPKEMDSPPNHFLRWNERSLRCFLKKHGLSAEVRKHQFGNWVFTFERIIAKAIPRLRGKYRLAETSGQGILAPMLRFFRKLLIVPAVLTYPFFLCFPAGGIQLFVVARRQKRL